MLENLYLYFAELFNMTDRVYHIYFPSLTTGEIVETSISWSNIAPTISIVVSVVVFIAILLFLMRVMKWITGFFFLK